MFKPLAGEGSGYAGGAKCVRPPPMTVRLSINAVMRARFRRFVRDGIFLKFARDDKAL